MVGAAGRCRRQKCLRRARGHGTAAKQPRLEGAVCSSRGSPAGYSNSTDPVYANPFDIADPIATPNGLNTLNSALPIALAHDHRVPGQGIPLTATRRKYQTVTRTG